jgi:transposase
MDGRRPTYDELLAENATLKAQVVVLAARNAELERQVTRLTAQVEALLKRQQELLQRLEDKDRAGKRQAAPFSKGPPKPDPQTPGRQPGDDYGQPQRRAVPQQPPDEVYDVPLPAQCPTCQSTQLVDETTQSQWQTDLPTRPIVRRFDIHCGHCTACGTRVQGRHELQTSDALGAAASQLGSHVHAAQAILNKELGLSHGKIARLMKLLFGITLNRSTSCRSILRTAAKCRPAYAEIEAKVRGSPVLKCDETGWKLGGMRHWLHVVVSENGVLYRIDGRRGHQVLAELIGLDYAGTLIHDGLASYGEFWRAEHQQCLTHLLKRCRELLETATAGAVRFPRAVKDLLQRSLSVRDRFLAGELTAAGLSSLRGRLRATLKRLVAPVKRHAGNERLAAFLEQHREEVFRFLNDPEMISATNNESEFELRFNVIARKLSGGNRTHHGRMAQEILPSITRTCRKLAREPYEFLRQTLCSPTPIPLYPDPGR